MNHLYQQELSEDNEARWMGEIKYKVLKINMRAFKSWKGLVHIHMHIKYESKT